MSLSLKKIVIIGLSGAGKSALFNKIIGKNLAIVTDIQHSTRDYLSIHYKNHLLIDTRGLDDINDESYEQISQGEKIIYVAQGYLTQREINLIKQYQRKLNLKTENWALIINRPKGNSFNHDYLFKHSLIYSDESVEILKNWIQWTQEAEKIQIALLGQTNSGKSTLFNRLLGYKRSIVSPEIGTTRDCIREPYKNFTLIDSPGYANENNKLDDIIFKTRDKLAKDFDGLILVINGNKPLNHKDKMVYSKLDKLGSFSCIYVNRSENLDYSTEFFLKKVKHIPIFYKIRHLNSFLKRALSMMNIEKKTSEINKWFHSKEWRLFSPSGKPVKIKYLCQFDTNPIKIYYFSDNFVNPIGIKTLKNSFKEYFKLSGIRVMFFNK